MAGSVLLCFRPFLPRGQSVCPDLSARACAFYSFLSEELKRLDRTLEEGPVSLRWSVEAMTLLKMVQIKLLALFKTCKLPIAFGEEDDWFNRYMQETAFLLDLCNSLKSAVSGINRYRMVIGLAMRRMAQGSSTCVVHLDEMELGRIGTKRVETVRECLEFELEGSSKTDRSIASVMLAAKCTTMVVSVLLASAMSFPPLSIDIGSDELTRKFPQLKPLVETLGALVIRFHERASTRTNSSRSVLAEHEMVDVAVGELKVQAMQGVFGEAGREKFMRSAELLRTSSDELREGIEMFDAVVDEVFEVVIKGRNEMLGVFRDGAFSVV